MTDDLVPCGYGLCRCKVDVEDGFCSAACASGTSGLQDCGCGHAECAESAAADGLSSAATA